MYNMLLLLHTFLFLILIQKTWCGDARSTNVFSTYFNLQSSNPWISKMSEKFLNTCSRNNALRVMEDEVINCWSYQAELTTVFCGKLRYRKDGKGWDNGMCYLIWEWWRVGPNFSCTWEDVIYTLYELLHYSLIVILSFIPLLKQ